MDTIMKLGLLAGGLVLLCVPRSFIERLATWQPYQDGETPRPRRSMAGPRIVGLACALLALFSLLM